MNDNNLKLKWYTFDQNNSGGRFVVNDQVDGVVIIQAPNADTANDFAEMIGIYFNGCSIGIDCHCCGDRWRPQWKGNDAGTDVPELFGNPVPYVPGEVSRSNGIIVYPYSYFNQVDNNQ